MSFQQIAVMACVLNGLFGLGYGVTGHGVPALSALLLAAAIGGATWAEAHREEQRQIAARRAAARRKKR